MNNLKYIMLQNISLSFYYTDTDLQIKLKSTRLANNFI